MNTEITVKSEKIFEGKVINLRVDTVELDNKKYGKREIVEHKGSSAIIAINDKDEILFVRQYRKPVENCLFEIPAGMINLGENPKECALRELREETGYEAKTIENVFEFYSSPGYTNEKVHLFLAKDLTFVSTKLDEDESIETFSFNKEETKKLLETGRIIDSKTLIGVLYWLNT